MLPSKSRIPEKASLRQEPFTTEQAIIVKGNFPHSIMQISVSIDPIALIWVSLEDSYLLHNSSINYVNFGRRRLHHEWNKGQRSSEVFSGTTGVNGFMYTKILVYLTSCTRNQSPKDLEKEVLIGFILLVTIHIFHFTFFKLFGELLK